MRRAGVDNRSKGAQGKPAHSQPRDDTWKFQLYSAGETAKSRRAVANLRSICDQYLPCGYSIEVVDLLADPERARTEAIIAVPTVIRKSPPPERRVIGDLSRTEEVLKGLDIPHEGLPKNPR
jgi:circadian clock protein KaiB